MHKVTPSKPLLIMLYGFPGAGKTFFARQLAGVLSAAHLHDDKIRAELFETPSNDSNQENVIERLMRYMAGEFLASGMSVIYDANVSRLTSRRALRDLARKHHAQTVLIWLQIDSDSAQLRLTSRDRRKSDDKHAMTYSKEEFSKYAGRMQNPLHEDYIVISGKHTFRTQKSAVIKKLYDMGAIGADDATAKVIKPGLVNLVPKPSAGRVDMSRRNIVIR